MPGTTGVVLRVRLGDPVIGRRDIWILGHLQALWPVRDGSSMNSVMDLHKPTVGTCARFAALQREKARHHVGRDVTAVVGGRANIRDGRDGRRQCSARRIGRLVQR